MSGCELVAVLAWCLGAGENMLANPGFEEVVGDRPARWDLFVSPKEGAVARLDDTAFSGRYAVMLHTATPYERDPANNWSQNVLAALGGKALRVSGYIKVEEATEAAIWVQCWGKTPPRILRLGTSSTDMPVYGTKDWEEVAFAVEAPQDTDFVTVRCVLKGTGTAWFDEVVLAKAVQEDADTAPAAQAGPPVAALSAIEGEVARLRDANLVLAEALERVQTENAALMEELGQLRVILQGLQDQLAGTLASVAVAPDTELAPPLVPHGVNWRIYR